MKVYEYLNETKSITDTFYTGSDLELNYLNSRGLRGWELITVIKIPHESVYVYYWQREKQPDLKYEKSIAF